MEISRIPRYFSNPYFCRFYTTTPFLFNSLHSSLTSNYTSKSLPSFFNFNLGFFRSSFSSSSLNPKSQSVTANLNVSKATQQFWNIANIVRANHKDLEAKLDSLNLRLTTYLVAEILRVLNNHKVSAFRFFKWVRFKSTKFPCNSDVYSLLIDNYGTLDDYEGMFPLLAEFRRTGIDLNAKAFGFLLVQLSSANEESMKISVKRVVELLNKVGGSCRASGVMALIEMFCSQGTFTMAKFVIEITERKSSFYNIIIREQCRRKDFEGAICTLNETSAVGCGFDVGILNYLLSCMCKNEKFDEARSMFEEMLEEQRYCPPNSLTFEVLICHLCELGNIDSALGFLDMMVSRGLQPRLSTHAAFMKTYFNLQRYEEAHSYAVDSSLKHARSKNVTYSLLATLYEKSGNLVAAQKILSELMDAGFKPNFPVYSRVIKKLRVEGKEDLANNLKSKFSKCS